MPNIKKEFSKVYDKYIEKIYRFVYFKVGSVEIAEDLSSETFLKYWNYYKKSIDPEENYEEIDNSQAFLYQIARNLIADHYRKEGRTRIVSTDDFVIPDDEDIHAKAKLDSDLANVRFALNKLKDDYQNAIIWHYLDDLPVKEVAKLLNKSENNTRVMLHRALKELKRNID